MPNVMTTHLALLLDSNPEMKFFAPTERTRGTGTTYGHSNLFETFLHETLSPVSDDLGAEFETTLLGPVSTKHLWEGWLAGQFGSLPSLATVLVSRLQQAAETFSEPILTPSNRILSAGSFPVPEKPIPANGSDVSLSAGPESLRQLCDRLETERNCFFASK